MGIEFFLCCKTRKRRENSNFVLYIVTLLIQVKKRETMLKTDMGVVKRKNVGYEWPTLKEFGRTKYFSRYIVARGRQYFLV